MLASETKPDQFEQMLIGLFTSRNGSTKQLTTTSLNPEDFSAVLDGKHMTLHPDSNCDSYLVVRDSKFNQLKQRSMPDEFQSTFETE